jgi:hypothetical protein
MLKILLSISITLTLVSCTSHRYETVEIIWKETQTHQIIVRGMGVKLSTDQILTSAHVVRDDAMIYEIGWQIYQVSYRDSWGDRAILSTPSHPQNQIQMPQFQRVRLWDPIYTEVSRSGSIVQIAGKVLDPAWSVLGYDPLGRVVSLSGIVLIDGDLQPGDSGAPIYTPEWELIDVVHVR